MNKRRTTNHPRARARCRRLPRPFGPIALVLALLAAASLRAAAADSASPAPTNAVVSRAEAAYQKALARYHAATNDPDAQWQLGRASFDWADAAPNDAIRAQVARTGIEACNALVKNDPKSAAGHYYLAMNLGELAQTRTLQALVLVKQMESEFNVAASLNAWFDYAGPDRNLGLLYAQAPGWPASIGSRSKANTHLRRAVRLSPGYPENRLDLIEAEFQWGDHIAAQHELEGLDLIWEKAQQEFAGDEWADARADWERRRAIAWSKVPKTLQTPRASH